MSRSFIHLFIIRILLGCLLSAVAAGWSVLPVVAASLHPHLYFTQDDLLAIRAKVADKPTYRAIADSVLHAADRVLDREIPIYSTPGAWPHRYICDGIGDGNDNPDDGCGGFLLFQEDRPHEHICPRCGRVYRGSPYDEAWISLYNDQVARHIRNLGLAYLLSGDSAYAEKAAKLCIGYAQLYPTLPLHDTSGGTGQTAGRLFAQTLDEAVWVFDFLWGLDAIYDSPAFSQENHERIEQDLLHPLVATLTRTNLGATNIQAWVSSAIGAIGFFLEDDLLINQALSGPLGYDSILENAYRADGFSYEGSVAYHYYGLSALLYLARIADRAGHSLWDARLRRALVAPLYLVEPDGHFPRLNDAGPTHLRSVVDLYEIANGFSDDPIFDQVLTDVYRTLGYRRTHDYALFLGKDFDDSSGLSYPDATPDSLGVEALRADTPFLPLMALLDRGPHGGAHGHYDKLNLILFAQGRELVPDLGTGSYVAPLLNGWLRRTIAHNTVLLGESDQGSGSEQPSPLTFSRTAFPSVQVVSAQAAPGVYPDNTQVERTVIKAQDDYLIVLDRVTGSQAPIDVVWHSLGRFIPPPSGSLFPTSLFNRWQLSTVGYQYLRPPKFTTGESADEILEIPPSAGPIRVTWRLPLSLSDNMEDLTLWDGECALCDKHTEGASSLRFLAIPHWTVSIGKDLSHPHLDLSSLQTLEFDYSLDEGQADGFWVILQRLPDYDRAAWQITALKPGVWHHARIDLHNPDMTLGGADKRTRLEFAVSATGDPEDSFFVYIDNIQAESAMGREKPLLTGLAASVLSTPTASQLLADGPGLRWSERHSILLSRVVGTAATFLTLLEAYCDSPQWAVSREEDGTYQVVSNDATDQLCINPDQHAYSIARYRHDGSPERLVSLNRTSAKIGSCGIHSQEPFDLDLQVLPPANSIIEYSYQTGSPDDLFDFQAEIPLSHSVVLVDGLEWSGSEARVGDTVEIGGLPGGTHRLQFLPQASSVHDWQAY